MATAKSEAEANEIKGQSRLKISKLKAQVNKVINDNLIDAQIRKQNISFEYN